jgi:glycosyltransferase involved in cell wall biosynthesis
VPNRILFVNTVGSIGGAERSLLDLIGGLDRSRFEPTAALLSDGPLAGELARLDVPTAIVATAGAVHGLSLRGRRRSLAGSSMAALKASATVIHLARTLRREGIALVHSNGLKAQLIAGTAARLSATPVLWHLRDIIGNGLQERLAIEIGSRCSRVIVANSDATRSAITDRARCPVVTIHNGVDTDRFRPRVAGDNNDFRREIGVPDGSPLVAMVGMFARWKGQHVFARAAQHVAARIPAARFVFVGDEIYTTNGHGSYRDELRQLIAELGLESRLLFAGYRHDMPGVMASIDVLVHASVQPEPFGRVLIEAMAAGTPVIATRGGGVTEIVTDGETGLLVPPDDVDAMAAAIERMLETSGVRISMGKRGRERVIHSFSAKQHASAIERVYETILTGPA